MDAAATARWCGRGLGHDARELRARFDGLARPCADDRTRDPPRVGLFAVLSEQSCERLFVELVHELARRLAARRVEAHIQRALRAEAERPVLVGKLVGAQAEVEEHSISWNESL